MVNRQNDSTMNTLAKIIQISLNAGDTIAIEAVDVQGNVAYYNPSLVITRIA
jgi:hypothetical protein